MVTLIVFLIALAGFVGTGLLAVKYGADSRHTDPRDMRHNWS